MKLVYIDESGNTGTKIDDPMQPYHLLVGLIVDDKKVRAVEDDIRLIGLKHFAALSRNTDFEFHGYSIHKAKGRYFSKLKIEKRIEIIDDLLNIIKNHNLNYVYIIVDKRQHTNLLHPHQTSFLLLVDFIERYLTSNNSLGLLIADENHDIEQRLIDSLDDWKSIGINSSIFGDNSLKVDHIIDSIHFVKSHNNPLIQLADVVAYILLRGKRVKDELMTIYNEWKEINRLAVSFSEWVELNASLKHKTELKHFWFLTSNWHKGYSLSVEEVVEETII